MIWETADDGLEEAGVAGAVDECELEGGVVLDGRKTQSEIVVDGKGEGREAEIEGDSTLDGLRILVESSSAADSGQSFGQGCFPTIHMAQDPDVHIEGPCSFSERDFSRSCSISCLLLRVCSDPRCCPEMTHRQVSKSSSSLNIVPVSIE